MLGKFVGPALVVALLAIACSNQKSLINEDDPFNDPFFHAGRGQGTSSLDEILNEPAPSVGWLSNDGEAPPPHHGSGSGGIKSGPAEEGVLLEAEGDDKGEYVPGGSAGEGEDEDEDNPMARTGEKSFYDKAQEATMATMSVLVGAGMAALPFLIGT